MKLNADVKCLSLLVALAITGSGAGFASMPVYEFIAPQFVSGGSGSDCPGPFTAYSIMTNSVGTLWITPPAGTTNAILEDVSDYPAPYASVASVVRKSDLMTWCAGNYVDFPVTNGNQFQLKIFVVSAIPTNTPLKLQMQVTWQP